MKKATLFAGALLLAGMAAGEAGHAQARPFTIGISGGASFPSGEEFSEEAGTGYHVQLSAGFTPAMLPVGLRGDLLWQELPDEHGGNFREIGGLGNAILALPLGLARPYVLGGLGAVRHDAPDEQHGDHVHEGDSETGFAWVLGGGIEFPFLGLTGALEARYLAAGAEHRSIPVSFGIRF